MAGAPLAVSEYLGPREFSKECTTFLRVIRELSERLHDSTDKYWDQMDKESEWVPAVAQFFKAVHCIKAAHTGIGPAIESQSKPGLSFYPHQVEALAKHATESFLDTVGPVCAPGVEGGWRGVEGVWRGGGCAELEGFARMAVRIWTIVRQVGKDGGWDVWFASAASL